LKLLRGSSIAAMGLALAAATGAVIGHIFESAHFAVAATLPTLFYGVMWGLLLRDRSTIGKTGIRIGWVASIPLAMANGALATGLLAATAPGGPEVVEKFFAGALFGATIGAICWVPGLIATLAVFGVPIAWSQRLAQRGLAGEERGEGLVGVASTVLGLIAAVVGLSIPTDRSAPSTWLEVEGVWLVYALSLLSVCVGFAATFLSTYRASRRKRFITDIERGAVTGFRIDDGVEGKVLVRIASAGEGYRVADVEEEVAALDEAGEVVAPLERRYL
jgi:hypothetical protein